MATYPMYIGIPHQMPPSFISQEEAEANEHDLSRVLTVADADEAEELMNTYEGHQWPKVRMLLQEALGPWWVHPTAKDGSIGVPDVDPAGPYATRNEAEAEAERLAEDAWDFPHSWAVLPETDKF